MHRAEWQHLCQEEAELALSQVIQLTESKKLLWELDSFSPAELLCVDEDDRVLIAQLLEVSSIWNGCRLLFSACALIHIPTGKGDIQTSFIYANGMRSYVSALSRDEYYEEATAESLLEIYKNSLAVRSCEAIWKSIEPIINAKTKQNRDYIGSRNRSQRFQRNWIVKLSRKLALDDKHFDFFRMVLDTDYRRCLKNEYGI